MIELFTARSGAPSVKVDGVAMHSPYDPTREAARFVQESLGDEKPSTVIVLGECIGHIVRAVQLLKPGTTLLAAVYSPAMAQAAPVEGVPVWHPGAPGAFSDFLRSNLGELQIEGLRVVEWPPAARAFPAVSRAVNEAVRQVVQELNGSFVTTVASGRRWLRNSLANFVHVETVVAGRLCPPGRVILVAAPGPSLEEAAPLIAEVRSRVELWALPSSCPFLRVHGLAPDLVIMTDPGFYSLHHLEFAPPPCPLAMPLSAARGTWGLPWGGPRGTAVPVFFLGQPVVFETSLLDAAGISAPMLPPHGTVAATAIELALSSTSGAVIAAGLDMSSRDLLAHARPNAFDNLLMLQASRVQPHASLLFHRAAMTGAVPDGRAAGWRVSPALRTYAGWFNAGVPGAGGRLYRLLPTAVALAGMNPLDGTGLERLTRDARDREESPRGRRLEPVHAYPRIAERKRLASRVLGEWAEEIRSVRARGADAADLARFSRVLEFSHLLAPRRLVDALKKTRDGNRAAARDATRDLLEECLGVIEHLGEQSLA
jgi:Protein of unknown function DUF115